MELMKQSSDGKKGERKAFGPLAEGDLENYLRGFQIIFCVYSLLISLSRYVINSTLPVLFCVSLLFQESRAL